jgi:putative ABC transport system permease protein
VRSLQIAIRKLLRRPLYSVPTILCLALGIGATTAIGSVVNALFLQSASVEDLDRVVFFMAMREGTEPFGVSPIEIEAYTARSRSFERLGYARTLDGNTVNLTGGERAERVRAAQSTTAYMETAGIEPFAGRLFLPEEERSGGPRALLVSHSLWSRRFGSDSALVGKTLRVNSEARTVIGILPPGFDLPSKTELWLPLELDFDRLSEADRGSHSYMMVGRLADGVGRERATEDLVAIARGLEAEFPRTNKGWSVALIPFRDLLLGDVRGSIRVAVYALAAAVGLLLLIACANAAHLFLARCVEQDRDIALSAALGASRVQLFGGLFLESFLISIAAGILGSAVALALVPLFMSASPIHEGAYTNFFRAVPIDGRVLALAIGASLLTALLFGSLPILGVLSRDSIGALQAGGRAGRGRAQASWSRLLVGGEVAVSAMLLVGAVLLARSLERLAKLDLGFRPRALESVDFTLPPGDFPRQSDRVEFTRRVLERVRAIQAVESAGTTTDLPLRLGTWDSRYAIEGAPPANPNEIPWAAYRAVSPGYLETLGVTLLKGRTFAPGDREGAPKVAVVTEELASRAWGDGDPIGKRIGHPNEISQEGGWWTVVGVVRDVKEDRYNFRIDRPVWYVPYEQMSDGGPLVNLLLRRREGGAEIASEVRKAVGEAYAEVAPGEFLAIEPHVENVVAAERMATLVALVLAVLGTVLASIGLYGVLAYSVRQRFRELGLRMAMGASPRDLSRLVLGRGLRWTLAGLVVGFAGSFFLARLLSNLLFQTSPRDPLTYAVVALVFAAVAAAACYIPSRRASATNPADALRIE